MENQTTEQVEETRKEKGTLKQEYHLANEDPGQKETFEIWKNTLVDCLNEAN